MRRLPDFLIIGAMKCGTSTLHEQLALRSGLFLSRPKEPNFFSDDEVYAQGLDWYARHFEEAREDQLCGESSTHYTKLPTYPSTVDRMARHLPRARVIYVMRDPIERIVSQYVHEWSERQVSEGIDEAVLRHERFVAYSCYARQLEPYLASYGPERILPLTFERLTAAPDAVLARVCRFLEDPSPEPVRWRAERTQENVSSERLRRSRLREGVLESPLGDFLRRSLPPRLRRALNAPWRAGSRPALSPEVEAELRKRIDPDLERLGRWLGRPLSTRRWGAAVRDREIDWAAARPDRR